MSRPPASMPRSRPRCWTSSPGCAARFHLDPVHQPQSRRSSPACATGSACSMPGSWWRRARRAGGVRRSAPSLHGRAAALPAAARPAQGSRAPRIPFPGFLPLPGSDQRRCVFAERCAQCDRSVPPRGAAASSISAAACSRCYYPDKAPDLPRASAKPPRLARTRTARAAQAPLLRMRISPRPIR